MRSLKTNDISLGFDFLTSLDLVIDDRTKTLAEKVTKDNVFTIKNYSAVRFFIKWKRNYAQKIIISDVDLFQNHAW